MKEKRKKLPLFYYVLSGMLLIWAIVDVYHYVKIGVGVLEHYWVIDSIHKLVANDLFQGVVKLLLAFLVMAIGLLHGKWAGRVKSKTALTLRLAALVLALWLMGMGGLTLGTAQYVLSELRDQGFLLASDAADAGMLTNITEETASTELRQEWYEKNLIDYMNRAIHHADVTIHAPSFEGYPAISNNLNIYDDEAVDCDTAVLFLDRRGSIVRESGDFIFFRYVTAEDWAAGRDGESANGWLDLDDAEDGRYNVFTSVYSNGWLNVFDTLRLTGYMEGTQMKPLRMDIASNGRYSEALERAAPGWDEVADSDFNYMEIHNPDGSVTVCGEGPAVTAPYNVTELDNMGYLEWDNCFDHTADANPSRELVTIYVTDAQISFYQPQSAVRYGETRYENLRELLKAEGYFEKEKETCRFAASQSQFRLDEIIVFDDAYIFEPGELAAWEIAMQQDPEQQLEHPAPAYTMLTALRANPLKLAMGFLTRTYWITFALGLMGFLWLRKSLLRNLIDPVRTVNEHIAGGWTRMNEYREHTPNWTEPAELMAHYDNTAETLRIRKNELTRLTTALDYAKTAEENRRQMTSNIAHELKTPLAVIHSYAEGLRERIADDKRDKYLDTILAETERMDAMVLEMLDLSRLEAGKVKLSRDEFSLKALTEATFEKLQTLLDAKELTVELDVSEDCLITADESRIGQVMENFASNAVKYTPVGGKIRIRGRIAHSRVSFAIENDAKPLTQAELSRVWDTFYRTDSARSGGGTGLGLAIAKSIVELHGGKCAVRNTQHGVEFSFTL